MTEVNEMEAEILEFMEAAGLVAEALGKGRGASGEPSPGVQANVLERIDRAMDALSRLKVVLSRRWA